MMTIWISLSIERMRCAVSSPSQPGGMRMSRNISA
jgi:hypothetical protein